MGAVALIEFFKYARLRFGGHALAMVGNPRHDEVLHPHQADFQRAAFGRIFDRVADQIYPYVAHHFLVAQIADFIQIQPKIDVFIRPLLFQQQNAISNLFVQRVVAAVGNDLLVFQLGQQQYIAGHIRQPFGFDHDDVRVFPPLLRR